MTEAGGTFIPPNLTPDGVLNGLSELDFIARFRVDGRGRGASPMPWEAFARMRAIYRYLRMLPSAEGPRHVGRVGTGHEATPESRAVRPVAR
jgi:hypothetical protein